MNQNNKIYNITPGYITGLTQSDGSFSCGISIQKQGNITFIPNLTIIADLDSKNVLDSVQYYLGCGRINIDLKNHTANYIVTSRESFGDKIIPYFDKYSLFCYNLHAFNLLKSIVYDLLKNNHKTIEGRLEVTKKAFSMNLGTTRKQERLQTIYSALGVSRNEIISLIPYTINNVNTSLTEDVLAGIIDGGRFLLGFFS